ncbi:acyl-CoA dehydrogenase family protein [Polaromonas jejuensis]|uniref:Acyl-[acyl-carrier-protein] dehydrogenase MbtN n=1 Tax=Polaromonas jejuensis TaxID=457502 RepID=A0ABW0QGZ7_9BURK
MDADLEMLRDTARRFFENECVPHEQRWTEQHHADRGIWTKAGQAGLLCASIPEEYGGGGGSFLHEAVICEEQSAALVAAFSNNVHSGIVAHYILAYGSEAQKRRWLPRMATGELVAAIAMSEPGAGTDLQRIKTSARRDGDTYVINGSKTFITNGYHANLIVVAVKTNAEAGAKGVSLVVLETDGLPGFRRGRILEKLGQKTLDTVELFFDEVRVPVDHLLGGEEGRGFVQLMQQLPQERLLIAVGAVATMHRAIADTTAYVRQRQIFGQPLMAMQNTRFKLAECQTQATVARSFVDDCIQRLLRGELDVPTAAMAKWWTTQTNCQIIDECLQLHGGYGYMTEYPIARMYADVRVSKIYGGANEVMKEIIARSMDR